MDSASFQLVDYHFSKVSLDSSLIINNDIDVSFEQSGEFSTAPEDGAPRYELVFSASAISKDASSRFIEVVCNATFEFQGVDSLEQIPDYFYQNSIAILFPYVRAYISLITNQANIKAIILPTLNLSKLSGPLKQNTKLKDN